MPECIAFVTLSSILLSPTCVHCYFVAQFANSLPSRQKYWEIILHTLRISFHIHTLFVQTHMLNQQVLLLVPTDIAKFQKFRYQL